MHTIIYPVGHKKHPQRKAAKDLSEGERRAIEDQKEFHRGQLRAHARAVLDPIQSAESVMSEAQE